MVFFTFHYFFHLIFTTKLTVCFFKNRFWKFKNHCFYINKYTCSFYSTILWRFLNNSSSFCNWVILVHLSSDSNAKICNICFNGHSKDDFMPDNKNCQTVKLNTRWRKCHTTKWRYYHQENLFWSREILLEDCYNTCDSYANIGMDLPSWRYSIIPNRLYLYMNSIENIVILGSYATYQFFQEFNYYSKINETMAASLKKPHPIQLW